MTLLTIPGPVDPHVHLRDLDWAYKATVERETAAALAEEEKGEGEEVIPGD